MCLNKRIAHPPTTKGGKKSEAHGIELLSSHAAETMRRKQVESMDLWQFKRKSPIFPE
jgi:hypothetical protein